VVAREMIAIAGAAGEAPVQVVDEIGCTVTRPNCPVSHLPISDYGIQGDGLRGQGFPAILGLNLAEAKTGNPLRAIGALRWIVELPRPGERTGRLIVNPSDADLAGFTRIAMSDTTRSFRAGLHDGIPGCISDEKSHARVCGVVMLDTGAPGLMIWNAPHDVAAWRNGDRAALSFGGSSSAVASETFTLGDRAQTSGFSFGERPQPPLTAIFSGVLPYLGFAVLYDATTQEIGLRPRPAAPEAPVGRLGAAP
jgi:hypothetical protein